ncbi:holo-[acyl-carrier-protein] synthase [Blochmannia endosymbiont of Polyrhachis (Hedomyrma) turneri]|nr:holo-[acyl-carrier-protein] synthase [Blochmannia endosymbiont of Polyrhachis (Hedomyrma) turneri]
MIYGIGIDFVEVNRVREIIFRSGDRFAERILSRFELTRYKSSKYPIHFLAKRFAVKEAASKAFGTGVSEGLFFRHFEVLHDTYGKPVLRLLSYAKSLFEKLSLSRTHVTLSDDNYYVFAVVIFER